MKQLDYEALSPKQLDAITFGGSEDPALQRPHHCRWVLDDDGELIGYRRPLMFNHDVAVRWETHVVSLETGQPIPLIDEEDLNDAPKKKMMEVIAEERAAGSAEVGDGVPASGRPDVAAGDTQWIAIQDIQVTTNVRQTWPEEELAEMRDNFKQRGFLPEVSRLLVRPRAQGYELILGGRRFRAASDLGITPVPCVVKEMSDADMLVLQLIENLKRKSLRILDEADAVGRLLELPSEDGPGKLHTNKSVAELLNYDVRRIGEFRDLRRLRGTAAGEAVDKGLLTKEHGVLLARVWDAAKRDELTVRILKTSDGRGALPHEVLATWIKEEVMIQLRSLEFDPDDDTLVPSRFDEACGVRWGGACGGCERNSKNAPDGERDPRAVPMCTHPACFRMKVAAAQTKWKEEMEAKGHRVLVGDEVKRIIDPQTGTRLAATSGFVELDATPQDWEVRESVTSPPPWRKLVKGQGLKETVFRDAKGTTHHVVERDLAIRAAVTNGHDIFRASEKAAQVEEIDAPADTTPDAIPAVERAAKALAQQKAADEAKREADRLAHRGAEVLTAQFNAVVEKARGTKVPEGFWPLAIEAVLRVLDEQGELSMLAERHGYDGDADFALDHMMKKVVAKLEAPFLPALLVEALISLSSDLTIEQDLPKWAKAFSVDLKAVKKTTEQRLDGEEAAAREKQEIANGVSWSSEKKGVEFEWADDGACMNPDLGELALPSGKFAAHVTVAHGVKGWVMGFRAADLKKKMSQAKWQTCVNNGTHYNSRATAFRAGLVAVRGALGELGAPPKDCERVEAYAAAIVEAAEKKAAKKGKK